MGSSTSKSQSCVTVVAIEIGSVNCGYAYSCGSNNPIYTGTNGSILPTDRIPTKLLLNVDETLNSIGTTATDKYRALTLQDGHKELLYFDDLSDSRYKKETKSFDCSNGTSVEAKTIYRVIAKFFYQKCRQSISSPQSQHILLYITIPNDSYVDLHDIIEGVVEGTQLKEEQIRVIFEMDAAALYCREELKKAKPNTSSKITNYAVVNLGGRNTTICASALKTGMDEFKFKTIKEPSGGESVVDGFLNYVCKKMMGENEWNNFQHVHLYDYLSMKEKLQYKINMFDNSGDCIIVEFPPSFFQCLKINADSKNNKVRFSQDEVKMIFDETLDKITELLQNHVQCFGKDACHILLCGGFSRVPYVREFIKNKLKPHTCLVHNPSLAVLKGAVRMGYQPYWRAKYAYGIGTLEPFNPNKHPEERKEIRDNTEYFNGRFTKIIGEMQMLENGMRIYKNVFFFRLKTREEHFFFELFRSKNKNAEYCDGCERIVHIDKAPKYNWPKTSFEFSLDITIQDNFLNVTVQATVNCGDPQRTYMNISPQRTDVGSGEDHDTDSNNNNVHAGTNMRATAIPN